MCAAFCSHSLYSLLRSMMILMASGEMWWAGEGTRRELRYDLTARFISLK